MKEWEKLHREKDENQRAKEEALKARGKAGQWPWSVSVTASAEEKWTEGPCPGAGG